MCSLWGVLTFLGLQAAFVQSQFMCEDLSKHENYHLLANQQCGRSFFETRGESDLSIKQDKRKIRKRIMRGLNAEFAEFPWMVQIVADTEFGKVHKCGGTLITDLYVLTAAHCFMEDRDLRLQATVRYNVRVEIGKHYKEFTPNLKSDNYYSHVSIGAMEIVSYATEDYQDDIALIRLAERVKFNEKVMPICLPLSCDLRKRDFLEETMTVAGWGNLEESPRVVPANALNKVNVTVKRKFYFFGDLLGEVKPINHEKQISAGTEINDACSGDSGGPLMYQDPRSQRYYEIGIVSQGNACRLNADYDHFGLYTRVTFYMKWILDNIRPWWSPNDADCNYPFGSGSVIYQV